MEVFQQETSNAVMAALLIYDLQSQDSMSHPSNALSNPLSLFAANSFHGGAWRCGYKFTAIGVPSVCAALLGKAVDKYLILYNFAQATGWLYMLMMLLMAYSSTDGSSTWSHIGATLTFFQNLAMMEVLHSVVGAVRSPWSTTLLQILSRVFVVGLGNWIPALQTSRLLYVIGGAWGLTEVIRYSWYGMNGLGINIKPFTMLRYSTFLPLYPIGVYGELALVLESMPLLAAADVSVAPHVFEYFVLPAQNLLGFSDLAD